MVAMKTNLKGVERGTAKAQAKFGGDVTQISDVVRATVVVKGDVNDLYDAVAMFKDLPALKSSLVSISNYDDRFRKPMGGGYRDVNVLVRVVHHVCELQFNLQKMIDVKESAAGHGNYERIRIFNDKAIVAAINNDTPALKSSLALGATPWVTEGKYRLSMLHFAALHGNRETVAALLELQADPTSLDSGNFLPLQRAIHHGHWDVCDQLLSAMEG
jgi:hypothetical protein